MKVGFCDIRCLESDGPEPGVSED
ncbi:P-loop NTPase family protein [Methylococcus geothermalis]